MNRVLLFALVLGCSPSLDDVEDTSSAITSPRTFILGGQSNTTGSGKVTELSPALAWYASPEPAVPYASEVNCPRDWSGGPCATSTGWEALGPRGNKFGPELSAGRRLRERFGDVAVIKHATNASNLFAHWDTTDLRYGLWTYATDFIDARMTEQPGTIDGLIWIQGESDATNAIGAEDYAENLTFFIMRFRQRYGCVPVVINRLHEDLLPSYPYSERVREEQEAVAALLDDVVMITTDDLELKSDLLHYTTESFIELGIRAADAMPDGCSS